MNTTARRIALVAPIATALLGFGITGANAQPYHPGINDSQIQNLPPVVVVDPPFGGDDPADPPSADPATPAPPATDSGDDDHDGHHSDHHHSNDTSNTRTVVKVVKVADNSNDSSSNDNTDEQATDTVAPVAVDTAVQPAGVQVPMAVVGAGALGLAGVVGWAAYRRYKMFN